MNSNNTEVLGGPTGSGKAAPALKTERSWLVPSLVIYAVIAAIQVWRYRNHIGTDFLSYVSIAEKYAAGNFADAINGYWSPLVSWMLTPLLLLGVDPLLGARILAAAIGAFMVAGVFLLSTRFPMTLPVRRAVVVSSVPMTLEFARIYSGSDLLVACLLVYYLYILFDPAYGNRVRQGVLCGVIGAAAYLSKSFALSFFLAHFTLFTIIYCLERKSSPQRRALVRNAIAGIAAFFIIAGPWIYLISAKYHRFTFSTVADITFSQHAPRGNNTAAPDPILAFQLIEPSNPSAVSGWEDPTFLELPHWSPFQSIDAAKYELRMILRNLGTTYNVLNNFSLLAVLIILASLLMSFARWRGPIPYTLLTMALYTGGYVLIEVIERYLWMCAVLLLMLGGGVLSRLFEARFFNSRIARFAALGILVLSFSIEPAKSIRGSDLSAQAKTMADRLSKHGVGGNIAMHPRLNENSGKPALADYFLYWHRTLWMAFHLKGRFYGTPHYEAAPEAILADLRKHDIDYYFVFGKVNVPFLDGFSEVTRGAYPGLRVYDVNP